MKNAETLLTEQIARCAEALKDCLAEAVPRPGDEEGWRRDAELVNAAKLLKASARLAEALARLRGETRHSIHVTREG